MKTDVIVVSSRDNRIEETLNQVEKMAAFKGLSPKGALHLRLLTEEMMGMVGSIVGEMEGKFWIEDEEGVYQLHLQAQTDMDAEKRKQLISASTSGTNEASRGLMGKLRSFFEAEDDFPVFYSGAMDPMGDVFGDSAWSMKAYRMQLEQYMHQKRKGAEEAWDELEKSVVAHVADDVKVTIRGRLVELVIVKELA